MNMTVCKSYLNKSVFRGAWLAHWVEQATLKLGVVSSSPRLGVLENLSSLMKTSREAQKPSGDHV